MTTKASAPGGVRKEKVGLPYDPELYDHMLTHGVYIEVKIPPHTRTHVFLSEGQEDWMTKPDP